jgi:glutamate-1-semialdehyde 2,1-aminomutase
LILGHAHPLVVEAVEKALRNGASFGAPTLMETRLAKLVVEAVPSVELVRFVNSGTEASMSAIRLARGFTGRDMIVKCIGCYHGHADCLLVQAGSGAATFGTPSSPGVPAGTTSDTLLVEYNSLESAQAAFDAHGDKIAAICIEPIAGNMGCVPPEPRYLQGLRDLCSRHGALLILDEVMTGFRVAYGGAQAIYGVTPDMTIFGKVIGGGLPCAAYGGRKEIMERISPLGPVYQAGTLSGNPLAMAAGVATLEILKQPGQYDRLESLAAKLSDGLEAAARKAGAETYHTRVGSMLCTFLSDKKIANFSDAQGSDTEAYGRFFQRMLDEGVYLAPSQFECMFVSLAHTDEDIDATISAAEKAFADAAR